MKERKEAVARALEKCLQGKYGEARELLAEVPGAEAELLLAKIDFAEGYWEKALEAANGALLDRRDDWEWLKLRPCCWQRLGFAPEDAADCKRMNELQPSPLEHRDLIFKKSNFLGQTTPELLYE
jgi:Flp pilus assembly protein TadD